MVLRVIQPIQSHWPIFLYYCWLYGAGVIQSIQTKWHTLALGYLFSLLLLPVWYGSNPAHLVALAYFSLLLLAVWCWSNPVHTDTVVYSCLGLSFSLLLLTVWCESNPAHTITVVYLSLLLLAVWCRSNPVHTDTVVYTLIACYLFLSYLWLDMTYRHNCC